MSDFNNFDAEEMKKKAEEVAAKAEEAIENDNPKAEETQYAQPDYTQPQQNNPQQGYSQPNYNGQPQQGYTQPNYNGQPQQGYTQPNYNGQPQQGYNQPNYNGQPPYNQPGQQPGQYPPPYGQPQVPYGYEQKSKMCAGLLGIFLGGFGVHNFYLGNTSRAVIQLVLTICSCGVGSIWGFIEGIMLLCGSINTDGNGYPLKD